MSLFEILISMVLFSIALLGLNAAQLKAIVENLNVHYQEIAQRQIQNMAERLVMLKGKGGLSEQFHQWNMQNQEILPQAKSQITNSDIELCWGDNNHVGGRSGCIRKSIVREGYL
ncbi:MAG TPA: hypothetical protein VHA13_00500 [Gammaproteobacteria bacterium]|nr:hypothetical protein [Gammaproteobacteria bacterium]